MTVENLEVNGTQVHEEEQSENGQNREALTLSVQKGSLLPQNRPIEPSHLQIVSTYDSVGSHRPVTKSDVHFNSSLAISGNRPIAVSTLQISESYSVMGDRPVAPNDIDDPTTLMGYID
jgi:hypothetical protein